MRMSGFLLGGMLGAAVALYVARNKPGVLAGMDWNKAADKAAEWARSARAMWDAASVVRTSGGGGEAGSADPGGRAER